MTRGSAVTQGSAVTRGLGEDGSERDRDKPPERSLGPRGILLGSESPCGTVVGVFVVELVTEG